MPLAAQAMGSWQKVVNRTTSANAPPNAGLQVGLATNELDRVPRNMHPSLAFENIRAAARGDNQQQQNPANPPAQQKQAVT